MEIKTEIQGIKIKWRWRDGGRETDTQRRKQEVGGGAA